MSNTSGQQPPFQPQPPVLPAQNGRPWYAKVISEHFGPLLLFGMAVGGGGYAVYLIFSLILTQQSEERADYRKMLAVMQADHSNSVAAQRKVHTTQVDRMMTLIIERVVTALERNEDAIKGNTELLKATIPTIDRTDKNAGGAHKGVTLVLQKQESLVPFLREQQALLLALLGERELKRPETVPPGRQRPSFEGTGPQ